MAKKLMALLLVLALCFSFAACDDEPTKEPTKEPNKSATGGGSDSGTMPEVKVPQKNESTAATDAQNSEEESWAIYWYLCGSDLESMGGAASMDLQEMMDVELPDNVKVVIQTGGASDWSIGDIDPTCIQRYVYEGKKFSRVDEQPQANMGEADTLADFLTFCEENYPADKTMVSFWNHGGGSVSGAAFDENYNSDSLTLTEFRQAFDAAYELDAGAPPVDIVGFDTCLMATVDTASALSDVSNYLVASEELEPGYGWMYTTWLQALADNPAMDGAELGKAICDTYLQSCEETGTADEATLSVVDLQKIQPLLESYNAMGAEALGYALEDPSFFGSFARAAENTENYGGNTDYQGYTNMADLGHLAQNCTELLPQTAPAVIESLQECVLYKVNGDYRSDSTGLSCYYSYNGDRDDLMGYQKQGCSETFKYLYDYGINGTLPEEGMDYISQNGFNGDEVPHVPDLQEDGETEYPVTVDDEGNATLELDQDIVNMLKGVYFKLAYVDEDEDVMLLLGQDNDIVSDWENGVFKDNFRGVWGALDDHLMYMEVCYEADAYTAYSVPILLNGEEYSLRVIYDYEDEQYYIQGARKGLDDNGMADKNLVQLKPGDVVTSIHYASTISGDDDFEAMPMEEFTVTENTSFGETDLGDGSFVMMFELVDAKNTTATSQLILFEVEGENCQVSVME